MLCASGLMAQNDTITTYKLDLGRNVSYDSQELTGAVSTITSKDLSHKNNSINPNNNLFGLLSGLQVLQGDGASWEDSPSMFVRGLGTLNTKSALILVDGFERSIKELASEEIESISVLKDAVATSLYGIRGCLLYTSDAADD